jgi:hypothetical protein
MGTDVNANVVKEFLLTLRGIAAGLVGVVRYEAVFADGQLGLLRVEVTL